MNDMEKEKRIYPSTQLVCCLDPKVLKVMMWILGWQGRNIIYYESQYSKALKMDVETVEKCIQTLVNVKLIDVSNIDNKWVFSPNAEQFQKYYEIPIGKVIEGNGIPMADEVTWNIEETKKEKKAASWEDLTESQLEKLIRKLQIIKNEKEQVAQKVVAVPTSNDLIDNLPW